jgi:hypothetical protein
MQAQQYAAAQPGAIAGQYQQQQSGQQGMYSTPMGAAQSYMGMGNTAGQANYNATSANNQATGNVLGQLASNVPWSSVASWF